MTAAGVSPFHRLLSEPQRRDAARLLERARVTNATFFRWALAGDVVSANGRTFPAVLALDRCGAFLAATCACTPKLTERTLCAHVAALVISTDPEPGGPSRPERFEASLWALALADAAGGHGTRAPEIVQGGRALPEPGPGTRTKEALLRRVTRTKDEDALNDRGAKTRRQAWEESSSYARARSLFDAYGDGWDVTACWEDERIAFRLPGDSDLRVFPPQATVERLLVKEDGRFLAERGFAILPGGVSRSFRLELLSGGALRIAPVLACTVPGAESFEERAAIGSRLFGDFLFLPAMRAFARIRPAAPFFAEPDAGPQAELSFDADYVPSAFGIPHDRETIVPAEVAARFLSRHGEEIAGMPSALLSEPLRSRPFVPASATLRVVSEREGRFLAALEFEACGRALPFDLVLHARRKGEALVPFGDRLVDAGDASFGWLVALPAEAFETEGGATRLLVTALDVFRLRAYLPGRLEIRGEGLCGENAARRLQALGSELTAPDPQSFGMRLYDFQLLGYRWLYSLCRNGLGGLLCDDMGLGKTHQAMALVGALDREMGRSLAVVVSPTSVLPHWEEKLRSHAPGVPLVTHHGGSRADALPDTGVVVTSYGVLRRDAALFAGSRIDLLVLDEAQSVKNHLTETHRAIRAIGARCVVGLTGTPLENSPADLKSLLDLVVPGYVPHEAEFRRVFLRPGDERGDREACERLSRLVRPFLLRRTKAQVLPSLPEKIVDRRSCSLAPEQEALYRETLAGRGAELAERIDGERTIPYLHVFALLSRLKQICNHPEMLADGVPDLAHGRSGKWDLFEELLDECLASGLKVVVFSQYVKMLKLIEAWLDRRAVSYATLKGETRDRASELRRFHEDAGCRVFTASLRAAGLGVDLTPASVVIHYDRWWNRAREEQATDRVHRMGQRRGVQVLKLITRGTIEERIDAIIERKGALVDELVREDDPRLARQFTRGELKALIAPLG